MADMIVFHHAQGLTDGVVAFANQLRAHGHQVSVPDLYQGATFATVEEGVAHAEEIGFDTVIARGEGAAEALSAEAVYAGFSLGALPAQKLAQTRTGARGAVLYHGGVPASTFATGWPDGVALQLHLMDRDVWSELDVVEELARTADDAELCIYPGSAHLFTDSSLGHYDPTAADLVMDRTLAFLKRLE